MRMHTPVCSAIHVHCVIPCTVHISIYTRACPLRESTCTYDYVPAAAIRVSRYIMRCTRFSANFSLVLLSAVSFLSFLLRNHRDRDSSWTYVLDVTLVHGAVHVCNVRQGSTSSGWIPRPITVPTRPTGDQSRCQAMVSQDYRFIKHDLDNKRYSPCCDKRAKYFGTRQKFSGFF